MKKNILLLTALSAVLLTLVGCKSGPTVTYQDPVYSKPLTTDFSFSDLNFIADEMVESMLYSPATESITRTRRPLLVVERIKNNSDQHINTESITNTIRTQLIRSGRFRFTDKTTRSQQLEELEFQNYSGMVDSEKATAMGKQHGAEYIVTGSIDSFEERDHRTLRKAYKFSLNLVNLQTGVIEWADEVPVGKEFSRRRVGS